MTPLIIAQYMAASAFFTIAAVHLFIWGRSRDFRPQLLFALAATAAGASAIAEANFYQATTIASFNLAFKWSNSINALVWFPALIWFVVLYTGVWAHRRWIPACITGVLVLAGIANIILPYGFLYREITALREITLPWGERLATAEGSDSPWRIVTDLSLLGTAVMAYLVSNQLWRQGSVRRAVVLGGSLFLYTLMLVVSGLLVDLGLLSIPYLSTYGYLLVALAMSYEIAGDVVRASVLSREVKARELRWQSLVEKVRLLITEVDCDGRYTYVNPYFTEVTGYTLDELQGESFFKVIPPEERHRYEQGLRKSFKENLGPHTEAVILTKTGEVRTIFSSSIVLYERDGDVCGLLSVSADITDQRRAEHDRDAAMRGVEQALQDVQIMKNRLEEEVIYLKDEVTSTGRFDEIIGESDALRYVLKKIEQVAPLDTTVMIEGETGVGKELVARAIHARSTRSNRSLVKVNCSALPASLIEAELFGHERGAFTGAIRRRQGRFELADGGTLLLDEVGELPLELQGKLLRVLQESELERIGSSTTTKVNVRIIAASNRNLQQMVTRGEFREDLYYRLNVYPITVPNLQQRREDIPLLVLAFVRRFGQAQGKSIDQVPQPVMDELVQYDWPGNVRELQNVIERAVITSSGEKLSLAARLRPSGFKTDSNDTTDSDGAYRGTLATVERDYILDILDLCRWRVEGPKGAAQMLGLKPSTLRFRMQKLEIQRPDRGGGAVGHAEGEAHT